VALYVPEGRRRRRVLIAAAAALVVGLGVGAAAGRLSATSVVDEVRAVEDDGHATAAGLRVIALHDQVGTGAGGAGLVLSRTRTQLQAEFDRAPWISRAQRSALLEKLSALSARSDTGSPSFGTAAEAMANAIDLAFAS
jgi:hypothetical protein